MIALIRLPLLLLLLLVSLLPGASSLQAKVSLSIDRNDITAGETFVLDIRIDPDTGEQPDLSLIPKEFTIVSNSQYHHSQMINGKGTSIKGWKLKLKTLIPGKTTIPAITVGNEATKPMMLLIKDSSDQVELNGQSKAIFMQAKVEQSNIYVQQQIIYTVSLYRAVNTHYASLSEPTAENSIVEKLGDDDQFEKTINNVRYLVTQRKYAIFPQQSGKLTISPVSFTADVADNNRRRSNSFLSATRPISISTQPIEIKVKRKPSSAPDPWLPANDLMLADKWTPQGKTLKVGEPVTWTLLLTVQGLSESLLPEIKVPKVEGLQWYYDAPQKERQINEQGLVGQRIEKIAVIPSKAGTVTIPAITVDWWDNKTNTPQKAVIPERTFEVLAAAEQASVNPVDIIPQVQETPLATTQFYQENLKKWQMATAVFLGLWLLTLLAYWKKSGSVKQAKRNADPVNRRRNNPAAKSLFNELKQALKKQDDENTEQLIIALINKVGYPTVRSLGALADRVKTPAIADKLRALESRRYSASQQSENILLDKPDIDQILRDLDRRHKHAVSSQVPPLYPR